MRQLISNRVLHFVFEQRVIFINNDDKRGKNNTEQEDQVQVFNFEFRNLNNRVTRCWNLMH